MATESFHDTNPGNSPPGPLGRVLAVGGSDATVEFAAGSPDGTPDPRATVGKFLGIRAGSSLVIGVLTKISARPPGAEQRRVATGQVDLLGEIKSNAAGAPYFQRGVTEYPAIGDEVELIGSRELPLIFDVAGPNTIDVGHLQQDPSIGAYVNVDDLVSKHFAVFGTTGVGKSSGVAIILQEILNLRPDLRIFLIDPHNEYGPCFGERAQVLTPANLRLPFWLFNFEETVDVFFRARPGVEEEVEILSKLIPGVKNSLAQARAPADRPTYRIGDAGPGYTVDTPTPYRLEDLLAAIDERMGKLENRADSMKYYRLKTRIETLRSDPRYAFMFEGANVGGDTMAKVLSQLFRLPPDGMPMTIMQLAGFPAEVVDSVVSVLCRMAFEFGLWSDGAFPLLIVCEEAHRYAPADRSIGFGPTRRAVSRIAKEGRKYGVFLGLVTQRPAELDATIIAQCSTLFAMRLPNDGDQAIVRAAVSDAAGSLLGFVPSLGPREVFAFGEGVALPTRLRFKQLPRELVPKSEAAGRAFVKPGLGMDEPSMAAVVERWRGATVSRSAKLDEGSEDIEALAVEEFSPLRRTLGGDARPLERRPMKPALRPDSYLFPVENAPGALARPRK